MTTPKNRSPLRRSNTVPFDFVLSLLWCVESSIPLPLLSLIFNAASYFAEPSPNTALSAPPPLPFLLFNRGHTTSPDSDYAVTVTVFMDRSLSFPFSLCRRTTEQQLSFSSHQRVRLSLRSTGSSFPFPPSSFFLPPCY